MNQINNIDISYCGNQLVFSQILLSALSLAKYATLPLKIRLFTMDLSEVDSRFKPITEMQCKILDEMLKEHNVESAAELIDARDNYLKYLSKGKNVKNGYTPYAQLRLLFDLYPLPDKMIYLDTDIMCCSDPRLLYDTDIADYEFAAVLDHLGKFWIRRDYCNSGVLLMNLKKIDEVGTLRRARELIINKKMAFADQSALNNAVSNKLILPRKFNEQRDITGDTVFKHFCKGIRILPYIKVFNYKQTDIKTMHKLKIYDFDDLYIKYDIIAEKYGFNKINNE